MAWIDKNLGNYILKQTNCVSIFVFGVKFYYFCTKPYCNTQCLSLTPYPN